MEVDSSLSTKEDVPTEINVLKLIKARAQEISMAIGDAKKKHPKLMSQQLPFHMRRRSVSHNIKRLPRRLREKLTAEAEKIQAKKTKRPSRKYRRRPKNLLSEYERRSRNNKWLETHIWFAKRFKMVEKWGYKLPLHSNDKSFRACYRATAKHCLLQDFSYYGCIEIMGLETVLLDGLNKLTSSDLGLTFASKSYINGTREGYAIVYHPENYPLNPIGPVSYLWNPKPFMEDTGLVRQLWIWCHPIIYTELSDVLISVFCMNILSEDCSTKPSSDNECKTPPSKKPKLETEMEKNVEKIVTNVQSEEIVEEEVLKLKPTLYIGKENTKLTLLKDQLVRFRLRGPLSQAVLNETFQLPENNSVTDPSSDFWWERYYNKPNTKVEFESQKSLWKQHVKLCSSAELACGAVMGLTVRDPRFSLPIKKTKAVPCPDELSEIVPGSLIQYPNIVSNSPLWSRDIRDNVKRTMTPTNEINKLRNEHFKNFGDKLDGLGENESRIPLIIVQNPGISNFSTVRKGGCDVILPAGWAMPFWIAFIYREARVGGLREDECFCIEEGLPIFPLAYPDSASGMKTAIEKRTQLLTQHFKYPPNKRPNFEILGVTSPFFPLWIDLVSQWSHDKKNDDEPDFFVLRNRNILKRLSELLVKPNKIKLDHLLAICEESNLKEALVFVRVMGEKGSSASEFTSICLLNDQEINKYRITNKIKGPVEPSHKTTTKEKVKTKNSKEYIDNIPKGTGLINLCSHKIIGYIIAGSFSFSNAQVTGNGFCSYIGLLNLLSSIVDKNTKPVVLLREQHSFNYHYGIINVPVIV